MSDTATHLAPSPWPAEDGGPTRLQHVGLPGPRARSGRVAAVRHDPLCVMVVHGLDGRLLLLRKTMGPDGFSWVEEIDQDSLDGDPPLARSRRRPVLAGWARGDGRRQCDRRAGSLRASPARRPHRRPLGGDAGRRRPQLLRGARRRFDRPEGPAAARWNGVGPLGARPRDARDQGLPHPAGAERRPDQRSRERGRHRGRHVFAPRHVGPCRRCAPPGRRAGRVRRARRPVVRLGSGRRSGLDLVDGQR